MVKIADLYPPSKHEKMFDNWGEVKVELRPSRGRRGYYRVRSMDMETRKHFEQIVPLWENFEAVIEWGKMITVIRRSGKLFQLDFGDGDPLYADDAITAWNLYKTNIQNKDMSQKSDDKEINIKSWK